MQPRRNSPKKSSDQVLGVIAVEQAKEFLTDSLNLPWAHSYPGYRAHFERWLNRWERWFTFRREAEIADGEDTRVEWETVPISRKHLDKFALKVGVSLRRIWYEKDARQRDWYFYRLRDDYHRLIVKYENPHLIGLTDPDAAERLLKLEQKSQARGDVDASQRAHFFETWAAGAHLLEEVPRICPFEAAVYWLQVNQKLMVYCEGPVCPAPYFFRLQKGQKYCSPECADPARKAAKLRWWNDSSNSPKNREKLCAPTKKTRLVTTRRP